MRIYSEMEYACMGGMIIVTVIAIIELIAILALVVFGGRYISNVKKMEK